MLFVGTKFPIFLKIFSTCNVMSFLLILSSGMKFFFFFKKFSIWFLLFFLIQRKHFHGSHFWSLFLWFNLSEFHAGKANCYFIFYSYLFWLVHVDLLVILPWLEESEKGRENERERKRGGRKEERSCWYLVNKSLFCSKESAILFAFLFASKLLEDISCSKEPKNRKLNQNSIKELMSRFCESTNVWVQ